MLQHSILYRKRQTYLLKGVNRCSDILSNSLNARIRVSELGFRLFTVINVNWESDGQVSTGKGASVADKFSFFDQNVQNKHKNSKHSSFIAFFNMKTNWTCWYRSKSVHCFWTPISFSPTLLEMSLITRKPVYGVFDQVRLKPACSATEATGRGLKFQI